MQYVTQRSSWATIAIHGESPRVMVLVRQFGTKVERYVSTTISHAPFPMDLTTARWHPGQLLALYHLPLKLCCLSPAHQQDYPDMSSKYGFKCSYNPTFSSGKRKGAGWVSEGYYGLDQGPIVMMIENYRSGLLWRLMRRCPYIVNGLRRAGFRVAEEPVEPKNFTRARYLISQGGERL